MDFIEGIMRRTLPPPVTRSRLVQALWSMVEHEREGAPQARLDAIFDHAVSCGMAHRHRVDLEQAKNAYERAVNRLKAGQDGPGPNGEPDMTDAQTALTYHGAVYARAERLVQKGVQPW